MIAREPANVDAPATRSVRTRRQFMAHTVGGLLALQAGDSLPVAPAEPISSTKTSSSAERGLPAGWRQMRKLDAHNHVFGLQYRPNGNWAEVESQIEAADLLGIETMLCSRPVISGPLPNLELIRESNDAVIAAMKRYPGRIGGYCFVHAGLGPAARDEIDRCVDAGMIGVKLYNQFKYTDPLLFPIAEKCIDRRILLLGHSGYLTDPRDRARQPKTSHALDFCELSRRFPELILILGHINGGGDWEWAIKGLRECPNVFLDTGGGGLEDDTIGACVRELGHERVLFATDRTMEGCVGKILSADLTPGQREDIFWRNLQRLLDRKPA